MSLCVHYVKKMIERISEPKKERCNILLNVFSMYLSLWLKKYIVICVLIIPSLLYTQPYDNRPFVPLQAHFN
jgi:hypothetical protein